MLNRNTNVDIIGVQMDFGASKRGVSMGPEAIRYGGIVQGLEREGCTVRDRGDIVALPYGKTCDKMRNYEQVIDVDHRLYNMVTETLNEGRFPITLGGDHSVAAGSIAAVSKFYENKGGIGVIWIDAHGDWNNEESSATGNMHGMPFSAVCGWGPDAMVDFGQKPAFVDPKHAVQVGGRDIDPEERVRMKKSGMTVFAINVIDERGMGDVIREAIEIASSGTAGIHLSFDVDAITPESAPGTGTTVHSGLTVREAFLAVEAIAARGKLVSMDMVEVNPILDEHNKTAVLASELVQSALGKVVF